MRRKHPRFERRSLYASIECTYAIFRWGISSPCTVATRADFLAYPCRDPKSVPEHDFSARPDKMYTLFDCRITVQQGMTKDYATIRTDTNCVSNSSARNCDSHTAKALATPASTAGQSQISGPSFRFPNTSTSDNGFSFACESPVHGGRCPSPTIRKNKHRRTFSYLDDCLLEHNISDYHANSRGKCKNEQSTSVPRSSSRGNLSCHRTSSAATMPTRSRSSSSPSAAILHLDRRVQPSRCVPYGDGSPESHHTACISSSHEGRRNESPSFFEDTSLFETPSLVSHCRWVLPDRLVTFSSLGRAATKAPDALREAATLSAAATSLALRGAGDVFEQEVSAESFEKDKEGSPGPPEEGTSTSCPSRDIFKKTEKHAGAPLHGEKKLRHHRRGGHRGKHANRPQREEKDENVDGQGREKEMTAKLGKSREGRYTVAPDYCSATRQKENAKKCEGSETACSTLGTSYQREEAPRRALHQHKQEEGRPSFLGNHVCAWKQDQPLPPTSHPSVAASGAAVSAGRKGTASATPPSETRVRSAAPTSTAAREGASVARATVSAVQEEGPTRGPAAAIHAKAREAQGTQKETEASGVAGEVTFSALATKTETTATVLSDLPFSRMRREGVGAANGATPAAFLSARRGSAAAEASLSFISSASAPGSCYSRSLELSTAPMSAACSASTPSHSRSLAQPVSGAAALHPLYYAAASNAAAAAVAAAQIQNVAALFGRQQIPSALAEASSAALSSLSPMEKRQWWHSLGALWKQLQLLRVASVQQQQHQMNLQREEYVQQLLLLLRQQNLLYSAGNSSYSSVGRSSHSCSHGGSASSLSTSNYRTMTGNSSSSSTEGHSSDLSVGRSDTSRGLETFSSRSTTNSNHCSNSCSFLPNSRGGSCSNNSSINPSACRWPKEGSYGFPSSTHGPQFPIPSSEGSVSTITSSSYHPRVLPDAAARGAAAATAATGTPAASAGPNKKERNSLVGGKPWPPCDTSASASTQVASKQLAATHSADLRRLQYTGSKATSDGLSFRAQNSTSVSAPACATRDPLQLHQPSSSDAAAAAAGNTARQRHSAEVEQREPRGTGQMLSQQNCSSSSVEDKQAKRASDVCHSSDLNSNRAVAEVNKFKQDVLRYQGNGLLHRQHSTGHSDHHQQHSVGLHEQGHHMPQPSNHSVIRKQRQLHRCTQQYGEIQQQESEKPPRRVDYTRAGELEHQRAQVRKGRLRHDRLPSPPRGKALPCQTYFPQLRSVAVHFHAGRSSAAVCPHGGGGTLTSPGSTSAERPLLHEPAMAKIGGAEGEEIRAFHNAWAGSGGGGNGGGESATVRESLHVAEREASESAGSDDINIAAVNRNVAGVEAVGRAEIVQTPCAVYVVMEPEQQEQQRLSSEASAEGGAARKLATLPLATANTNAKPPAMAVAAKEQPRGHCHLPFASTNDSTGRHVALIRGKVRCKLFSCQRYGKQLARAMATTFLRRILAEGRFPSLLSAASRKPSLWLKQSKERSQHSNVTATATRARAMASIPRLARSSAEQHGQSSKSRANPSLAPSNFYRERKSSQVFDAEVAGAGASSPPHSPVFQGRATARPLIVGCEVSSGKCGGAEVCAASIITCAIDSAINPYALMYIYSLPMVRACTQELVSGRWRSVAAGV